MHRHIHAALQLPEAEAHGIASAWLDDFNEQQDVIPLAVATTLGVQRTSALATQAEQNGLWWSASLRWAAAAYATRYATDQQEKADEKIFLRASAAALAKLRLLPQLGGFCPQDSADRLEFSVVCGILRKWDMTDGPEYKPRLERLLQTDAAREDPGAVFTVIM